MAAACPRRRRRAHIYCRFSTDQQTEESLADQEMKCRRHLQGLGLGDVEITVTAEAAITGELARRPGIDKLWAVIEDGGCDLIITEEVSRLYRHSSQAMSFIGTAVDAGIRVIAINDSLDTNRDDWQLNGHFAAVKAELDNKQTRQRIARSILGRWDRGEVVNQTIRPGYTRVPVHAVGGDPAAYERGPDTVRQSGMAYQQLRGPFIDKRDDRWTSVIRRAFELCARKEPDWVTAKYLNEAGLPRSSTAKSNEWSQEDIPDLILDPIYYGVETYRNTHCVKKFGSGQTLQLRTPEDQVWRRKVPHLAHIDEWLWQKANDVLAERAASRNYKSGADSPQTGIPRDQRGPLSKHFSCGICNAPMYRDFGYRCGNSKWLAHLRRKLGKRCWSRAMPPVARVHANISRAIVDTLTAQEGRLATLYAEVVRLVQTGDPSIAKRLAELRQAEADLDRACKKLGDAVEKASDVDELVTRLRARTEERDRVRLERDRLLQQSQITVVPPSFVEFLALLNQAKADLLGKFGREIGPLLRRLTSPIRAVPYRAFDRQDIVLRAHFELHLLELFPNDLRQFLDDRTAATELAELRRAYQVPLIVDLFKPQKRFVHAAAVHELVHAGLTLREAGRRLGVPETTAQRALKTAEAMAAQGLNDPCVRVEAMPKRPPRWRPHVERPDVFDVG
jgi:DNA invertase Pin-like site-specific DNA recombinase